MNFIYHDVSPSPDEILYSARSRIEEPHYRVAVSEETEKIQLLPITGSHFSFLYIDGERAASDYIHEIELNGKGRDVEIKVISEDKTEQRVYRLSIIQEERG